MNDIVITGDDTKRIDSLKKYLQKHFQTKDLGSLKYFLAVEVDRSKKGILLSHIKYVLNLFSEDGMLECKSFSDGREREAPTRSGGAS